MLQLYLDYAVPLAKQFAAIWPPNVSTLEQFQWAYSIVLSRYESHLLMTCGKSSAQYLGMDRAFNAAEVPEPTLLPVIDMANHEADTPAAHIVKTDSGSYQVRGF